MNATIRFRQFYLLVLITFIGLNLSTVPSFAQGIFADKNLEAAVRKEVYGKRNNDEPIVAQDVVRISQVIGRGMEIKDLTGLEYCKSLLLIDLDENQISDLSPIAELSELQSLSLAGNSIKTIEPLKELKKIQYLNLERNEISDLSPVKGLMACSSLYLSDNNIESIKPIIGMSTLWSLHLAGNPVSDLEAISELQSLTMLDLSRCGIAELNFLKPLNSIRILLIAENEIESLDSLLAWLKQDDSSRYAPFLRIYATGNPLSEKTLQETIPKIEEIGPRIRYE